MSVRDTDVIVLGITATNYLNISELWGAFGAGKGFGLVIVHDIAKALRSNWYVVFAIFRTFILDVAQ